MLRRILNYGTITVAGTRGTREPFQWVKAPLEFRQAVRAHSPA